MDIQLEDLDFTDDLALLSHTDEQTQMKTASVAEAFGAMGFNIHKGMSKIFKYNTKNTYPITLDGEALEDVESPMYLVGIVDERRRSNADVNVKIGNPRAAYLHMKNIWDSKQLSTNIKVTIFYMNFNTFLLYRSEIWIITTQRSSKRTSIYKQLSTQDNQCPLAGYHLQQPTVGVKKKLEKDVGNG
ncbi:unnamed protein product [Schistosoma curassoni]|uniref:DUF6451 domain-containing protein n=1 Tax=Schistosoma curassoni TaxID=6186 RepID=A0A183KMC4_9TREM|nr:unnamed protein product [Schistosoma curassoni]